MNAIKKSVGIILALLMTLSVFAVGSGVVAQAAGEYVTAMEKRLIYYKTTTSDGRIVLSKFKNGYSTDSSRYVNAMELPYCDELEPEAFKNLTSLRTLSLTCFPKNLGKAVKNSKITILNIQTDIPDNAFFEAETGSDPDSGLSFKGRSIDVMIGSKVKSVGKSAFYDCDSFVFRLSNNMETIGMSAFYGCAKMQNLVDISKVKKIEPYAFSDTYIQGVKLCADAESIGDHAFYRTGISSVTMPKNLKYIDSEAFNETSMKELYVPPTVYFIGSDPISKIGTQICGDAGSYAESWAKENGYLFNEAFEHTDNPDGTVTITKCNLLKLHELPTEIGGKQVSAIGANAFENVKFVDEYGMDNPIELVIGGNIKSIGELAFRKCMGIAKLTIEDGVEVIGAKAFYRCDDLKDATVSDSVKTIDSFALGFELDTETEEPKVKKGFFISDSGETARKYAEKNNIGVVEGKNVLDYEVAENGALKIIGLLPGAECPENLVIPSKLGKSVVGYIADKALQGCKAKTLTIEKGVTTIGAQSFADCKYLEYVSIADSVSSIGKAAFEYCRKLKRADLPAAIKKLEEDTFQHCESLESIIIPDTVTDMGESVFFCCSALKAVVLPNTDIIIENSAFSFCESLTELYIPESVKLDAGKWTNPFFSMSENFTLVVHKDSQPETVAKEKGYKYRYVETKYGKSGGCDWEYNDGTCVFTAKGPGKLEYSDDLFTILNSAKSFVAEDGVKAIGEAICFMSDKLLSVSLADSVTEVGEMSFASCKYLRSISLGKGLEKLGNGAFTGSDCLDSITISESNEHYKIANDILVTADGKRTVLFPAGRLDEVISVPDGVETIGSCCFTNCAAAKKIILPDTVKTLEENAFSNCKKLETIDLPDGIKAIPTETFYGYEAMKSVKIPESVSEIGTRAMGWYWDTEKLAYAKVEGFKIIGMAGTVAEKYAKENGFGFEEYVEPTEPPTAAPTQPTTAKPTEKATEKPTVKPTENGETKPTTATDPAATTEPVATTEPQVTTAPEPQKTTAPAVIAKKANPVKVTVKTKTVKLKNLKKKKQTVKAITVKNAKGKVTYKLTSVPKKIKKLTKISSKGVITIKKWKKAKKGTYKFKVNITAAGNADYNKKSVTKTVTVKIK